MASHSPRIVVYTKDVQKMIGCSSKTAQKLLRKIRGLYQKDERELVSVTEFCAYTRFDEKVVRECITD
jgi:hypothetical protein